MSTVTPPFKVLIAGGSVSGLTLALTLECAGIDYELFEKGDIDTDLGASIAINGPTVRILHQLGVWAAIEPIVTDVARSYRIDGKTGHTILDSNYFQSVQDEYV
jgi:2-polyprenyl-6-methoxyphenol hydroxylase and related FAD-dependent oxidoreductases